jgi:hypothetical protein
MTTSYVHTCFGPSMLSVTWILCYRLFSYLDVPVYPCTTWLPLIEILWQLGHSWVIFLCKLYKGTSKIKIKDLALFVRNVQLSPAVRMGHVKAFEKTSCKYPIRCVEVKVDTVQRRHRKSSWPEWSNMKSRDRKWRHYRKYVLRMLDSASSVFSYYCSNTKWFPTLTVR